MIEIFKRFNLGIQKSKGSSNNSTETKTAFLANISHEIRNPLGAILGFSDLLVSTNASANEKIEYVDAIRRNSDILLNVIDDWLDLNRVKIGKLELNPRHFELRDMLESYNCILGSRAIQKGLSLTWNISSLVPNFLFLDSERLRQILFNLIGNAIKFTQSGTISIDVFFEDLTLVFRINDTGCGIPDENKFELFSPFYRVDETYRRTTNGTGIGLSLSKNIARLMGGDVNLVSSSFGFGSVFEFTLPFKCCSPDLTNYPTDHLLSGLLSDRNILLVEDAADNQLLVSCILRKAGANITLAANGIEAIKLTESQDFDTILMDLQMPLMDGYEATQVLRLGGFKGHIIALTAHSFADERRRCFENGFNDHISKPVNSKILIEKLNKVPHKNISKNAKEI